jgi:hypothetical protein
MSVTELLNYDKLLDEGEKIILKEIKKAEEIDDKKRHLHVIDCLRTRGDGTAHWSVVAAVLYDDGREDVGGWIRFIGYKGGIERVDVNKPLSEQIQVKKSEDVEIDCYLKSGNKRADYRPVTSLRELADIIQKRYLDGKF